MFLVIGLVIGGLAYYKVNQIMGFIRLAQTGAFAPPPPAVCTTVVAKGPWSSHLRTIGTVAPIQGVTLSVDLGGIVERIAFVSGARLRRGDVLLEVDSSQERAQLAQAIARRDLARLTLERDRNLLANRTIAKSEYDAAEAEYRQDQANVDLCQATIQKKTVRAPFDGIAGIRQVDVGQYITPGQPVVALHSLTPVYVNFNVPQQSLAKVKLNQEVTVRVNAFPGDTFSGKVTSINAQVDPASRNVWVQATVGNQGEKLRPGTFVDVSLALSVGGANAIAIPATAVDYGIQGTAVYVITAGKQRDGKPAKAVQRRLVTLGDSRGDRILVTSGLNGGEEIVTAGVFRLLDGMNVVINNSIQPENALDPTPADS